MPIMTNKRRDSNGDYVTGFVGVAYIGGETYNFPDTNNRLSIRNCNASTLTLVLNGTTYTILPFASILLTENYTQFTISSNVDSSAFEVMSIIDNADDPQLELDGVISQLNDKANITYVDTKVAGAVSGAPKAVSLISQMTDITKNYVYTGSEGGYTAGNWYYYNGSAWVSGGIYQSTGIADDSVSYTNLKSNIKTAIQYEDNLLFNSYKKLPIYDNLLKVTLTSNVGVLRGLAVSATINDIVSKIRLYAFSDVSNTITCSIMTDPTNPATLLATATATIGATPNWIDFNFADIPVTSAWLVFRCTSNHPLASCNTSTLVNTTNLSTSYKYCPITAIDTDFRATAGTYVPTFQCFTKKLASKPFINTLSNASKVDYIRNIISSVVNVSVYDGVTKHIKLIGDSITHGQGGTGFAQDGALIPAQVGATTWHINTSGHCWANDLKAYMESKFCCNVLNYGCTGITSSGLLDNIGTLIEDTDDIVICMIGTNDRSSNYIKDLLKKRILSIYDYVTSLGKKVIFMSSIPSSISNDASQTVVHMEDINNIIMGACASLNVEYISLYNDLIDYCINTGITIDSLLSDGLHPNDTGYDVILYLILIRLGLAPKRTGATW